MSIMIEVLEWIDPTGDEMIFRIPQEGSADIKLGAQLIVRDSQTAIFFKNGHAADTFTTGRHTLSTLNLSILTRLLSLPFGFNSPFRTEVYFINQKVFTNLKWGTKHPVTFKDSKLGLIRLRGFGAKLELESDFYVLTCDFCSSVLRIIMPDLPPVYLIRSKATKREIRFNLDRYLKEHSRPLTDSDLMLKKLYYPYWKIDAIKIKIRNKIHEKLVCAASENSPEIISKTEKSNLNVSPFSSTVPAGPLMPSIPASIGVRSQTMEALPFSRENLEEGFDSMSLTRNWTAVWEQVRRGVTSMGNMDVADFGKNRTELIHPEFSVVYFPYFQVETLDSEGLRRYLLDGLSARVLCDRDPTQALSDAEESGPVSLSMTGSEQAGRIKPDRLAATAGSSPSGTVSLAAAADEGLTTGHSVGSDKVELGELRVELHRCSTCGIDLPDEKTYVYICHNCHELKIAEDSNLKLKEVLCCRGDSSEKARMFPFWSFAMPAAVARKLRFIFGGMFLSDSLAVPAFDIPNYDAMLKLARRISFAVPRLKPQAVETISRNYDPVTVSLKDAARNVGLLVHREKLARQGKDNDGVLEFIPRSVRLIYVPFIPRDYFFVDAILDSITIEKRALQ